MTDGLQIQIDTMAAIGAAREKQLAKVCADRDAALARVVELESALTLARTARAGPDAIEAAAKWLSENVIFHKWDGHYEGRAAEKGFMAWGVGGCLNARKEDYRDAVRKIVEITGVTARADEPLTQRKAELAVLDRVRDLAEYHADYETEHLQQIATLQATDPCMDDKLAAVILAIRSLDTSARGGM